MTDVTLATILMCLMFFLLAAALWTFWRLVSQDELPSIEVSLRIARLVCLGLVAGICIGIPLGGILLDNLLLGISLGAGGGLSLSLGIVNLPWIQHSKRN